MDNNFKEHCWMLRSQFETIIDIWKEKLLTKPVIGCRSGSQSSGFGNEHSGANILLLCEKVNSDDIWIIDEYTEPFAGDIIQADLPRLKMVMDRMREASEEKQYPSVFYRDDNKMFDSASVYLVKSNDKKHKDDILFFTFCHEILRADVLYFKDDSVKEDFPQLCANIKTIDFLDSYYVRSYGNWCKFIVGNEKVLCRKYLYTIEHLFTIWWILYNRSKPPKYFPELCESLPIDGALKEHINKVILLNSSANVDKVNYKIESDEVLNENIKVLLEKFEPEIFKYDKNETFDVILNRTSDTFLL